MSLNISTKLAKKLMNSPKVKEFHLILINESSKVISSIQVKKEKIDLKELFDQDKENKIKLELKTKDRLIKYNIINT